VGVLRTVLALCVVGEHSGGIFGLPLVPGFIAVQIFYVASGFYMALILTEKYIGPGAWWAFYVNRFLRLFPIYYVVLALTLAGTAIAVASGRPLPDYLSGWQEFGDTVAAWKLAVVSLPNFTILGMDLLHFFDIRPPGTISLAVAPSVGLHDFATVGRHFSVVPQAWTLSIELMFYAIVPSIVRWRSSALLALLAGSGIARAVGYSLGFCHDPWDDRFFPFELSLFVAGMLLYRAYRRLSAERDPERRRLAAFGWSGLAAGVTAILFFGKFTSDPDFASIGYGAAVNCLFIAGLAALMPLVFHATRHSRIDNAIGQFSYPVYISHFFFIFFLTFFASALRESPLGFGPSVALASLAFSGVLLRLMRSVESQRTRLADRSERRPAAHGIGQVEGDLYRLETPASAR